MTKDFIVLIPRMAEHGGYPNNVVKVLISKRCPTCGKERLSKLKTVLSYDGSRRLTVDGWENSCGHIDKYEDVREEGQIVPFATVTTHDDFLSWALNKYKPIEGSFHGLWHSINAGDIKEYTMSELLEQYKKEAWS